MLDVLAIIDPIVGLVLAGCGLMLWARRRQSLIGLLLLAGSACWFLGSLWGVALFLHRGPLVHLHLSYPTGRTRRPVTIAVIMAAYAIAVVEGIRPAPWLTLALAVVVGLAAVDGYARTSGRPRKAAGPGLIAALGFASVLAFSAANQLLGWGADKAVLLAYDGVICLIALGLTVDLRWGRWTDATVADFLTQLGAKPEQDVLLTALRRALSDPTAQLGYWSPDRQGFVDDHGASVAVDTVDRARTVLTVDDKDRPLAIVICDAGIHQDPELLADVQAGLRIALQTVRLRRQVRSNVTELTAARRRIVEAADREQRAFETVLNDGPQRALTEAAETLVRMASESDQARARELGSLAEEIGGIQRELVELVAGVRPPELASGGLAAALPGLARNVRPLIVDCRVGVGRLPDPIEGALYFFCAEALTNVVKHSGARKAEVTVCRDAEFVRVRVADDGVGGADPDGTGLRGLSDRVVALGGAVTIKTGTIEAGTIGGDTIGEVTGGTGTVVEAAVPLGRDQCA